MFDTLIIGNGPAGISAAVYLKRFNINPIVIGKDYGALAASEKVENYYGFKTISGQELIDLGKEQCKHLNIELHEEEVLSISIEDGFYKIKTNINTYDAKTVLLATGKNRPKIKANNLKDFEGKGISYCATCDGFFYRKKKLAIVGDSDFMLEELEVLNRFTDDITIFTNGQSLENNRNQKVITDKIVSFEGTSRLTHINTETNSYEVDGCFIAMGSANALDFAYHLGIAFDDNKNIIVDKNCMTNVSGVFAAGDVTGGLLQITKATSDGTHAAFGIKKYLSKKSG